MPSRPLDDGVFTPRQFPIDPFNPQSLQDPWHLDTSSLLPSGNELCLQPKVILVLGEPQPDAIAPLLRSTLLESSLLILATARSCLIPPNTCPAVVILRLSTPILSSDAAAARLVAVLQWANHVACAWRADKSPPQFQEITEDGTIAGFLSFGSSSLPSRDASPARNSPDIRSTRSLTPPLSLSRAGKRASIISSAPSIKTTTTSDHKRPASYAFDALFNFLPSDLADRQILKQAILVTTVSRPFLTCILPTPSSAPKRAKRFSLRPSSSPPTPPPLIQTTPAHIVHIIPPCCTAVIRPLESFSLNFSSPTSSRATLSIAPPGVDMGTPGPTPRPFITTPNALSDVLLMTRQWTLAELIVCGALDGGLPADMGELGFLKDRPENDVLLHAITKPNRAWIGGVNDITLSSSLGISRVGNGHVGMEGPSPSSSHRLSQYSSYPVSESLHTRRRRPSMDGTDVSRATSSSIASSSSRQPYNPQVCFNDPQPYPDQDQQQPRLELELYEQAQGQQRQSEQPGVPSRPPRSPLRSPSRSPSSSSSHSYSFSYPTSYHIRKRSVSATGVALEATTGSGSGSELGTDPRSGPSAMVASASSSGSVSVSGVGLGLGMVSGSANVLPGSADGLQRRTESTPSSSLSHSLSPSPGFITPSGSPPTSPSTSPDIDVAKMDGGSGEGGSSEDANLDNGPGDGDDREMKAIEKDAAATNIGKTALAPAMNVKGHATGGLPTPPPSSKKWKGLLAWIKRR